MKILPRKCQVTADKPCVGFHPDAHFLERGASRRQAKLIPSMVKNMLSKFFKSSN